MTVMADLMNDHAIVPRRTTTDVDDLGKLSADAVRAQYAAAAKSVEAMGEEILKRVGSIESALAEAECDLKLLEEAAAAIREKGNLVALQIEEMSSVSKDIRTVVAEFKKKMED